MVRNRIQERSQQLPLQCQIIFRGDLLGDIPEYTLDPDDLTLMIIKRRFDDMHVTGLLVEPLVGLCGLDFLARAHHLLVILPVFASQMRREKIHVILAKDFLEVPAQGLTEILVGKGETTLGILTNDMLWQALY